ncbi:hypothetical protein EYC84_003490 [Monilinia fructicola]|uniref:Uncharacterized protein n=1 Tax=Monilinia fructicola TaxID=38448 RepID=A0A5M9JWC8_MONFR|nr:hypothetical protein EYC84_003490 [Monilinia fructicola]
MSTKIHTSSYEDMELKILTFTCFTGFTDYAVSISLSFYFFLFASFFLFSFFGYCSALCCSFMDEWKG